ncbi:MAG: ATP-binding protein, partial [Actinomycetota bacterium]|nr:ATP-binding protein [Actinomycetota bacterium]
SEVSAASPRAASGKFSKLVMEKVKASGGRVPEEALRELIENLIHAEFRGVVISVLEEGDVVRISDKGPGIEHKERAFEFGFSGAAPEAVREIRGVGAGLGIARAAAEKVGGTVIIEDNIGGGTVATVSTKKAARASDTEKPVVSSASQRKYPDAVPKMNISERQQKVLITVLECGEVGPSTVAEKLEISVSTAYRDLSVLEEHGLVIGAESGKRMTTPLGRDVVEAIVNSWVK